MSDRPAPFDGPQWDGWEFGGHDGERYMFTNGFNIYESGELQISPDALEFKTPELARQVAECIIAAQKGEPVGPVGELVEALSNLALSGIDDFGGSYVNLQADKDDIAKARAIIKKYEVAKS